MRRILVIVAILVAAAAIVAVGVLLRGGRGITSEDPPGSLPAGTTLPIAGNGGIDSAGSNGQTDTNLPGGGLPTAGIVAVSQAAVADYAVGPDGITFIATNGAVISSASSTEAIGQADSIGLAGAWFSPDGKWLLVKAGTSDAVTWSLFDVAKKTWRSLQANTSEMAWSPDGSRLAYFARRTNGATVTTYVPATNSTRALLALSAPDLRLQWKDAAHLFIMDRPSSLVAGTIWDLNATAGTLTQFATNASGVQLLWGGASGGGLLFKAGPTGGVLSLVDEEGSVVQGTNFLTLPPKCVFGESAVTSTVPNIGGYLFCAIPQDQAIMKESQLPDDYLKGKFGTADALYVIDLLLGTLRPVLPTSPSFTFDAANLKIYGGGLYFINRNDRKLYRVSLEALSLGEVSAEEEE